ncbi:MAG: hypothetical protein ACO1OB_05460, partial [Archangium sp.]
LTPSQQTQAEALYREANEEKKARNYERAIVRAERCVKAVPDYYPCYRVMGSVYASISARDQSMADMKKARLAYQRYLELAPATDEYVPRVRAILDSAQ